MTPHVLSVVTSPASKRKKEKNPTLRESGASHDAWQRAVLIPWVHSCVSTGDAAAESWPSGPAAQPHRSAGTLTAMPPAMS